jgi:hypothetical protein
MAISLNNNLKNNIPTIGAGTFASEIVLAAGAYVLLQNLPSLVWADVSAAAAAIPQAYPPLKATTAIQFVGSASGLKVTHNIAAYTKGMPIPHLAGGAGADPNGMFLALGDFSGQTGATQLAIVNTTGGNLTLYVTVYGE